MQIIDNIKLNDYIRISSYSDSYGVSNKKIYRYINDNIIDFIIIDKMYFVKDVEYLKLQIDHRRSNVKGLTIETPKISKVIDNQNVDNVKGMTIDSDNVKGVTIETDDNVTDNQVDSDNVKGVTLENEYNVKGVTLSKEEIDLLNMPEEECLISDYEKIKKIKRKLK